ncbi:MAG: hypothetical protein SPJ23_01075 [Eubacteriales bacterium]|nr:hypothetical protein [Eubacteriales bacterium]
MDALKSPAQGRKGRAERRITLFTFLFVYALSILNNTLLALLLDTVRSDVALSSTALPYLIFYLRIVLSAVWLYVGAAAVARAVCLRRMAAFLVSAFLLFGAMELTDFLPILVAAVQYDSQSLGSLITSNFSGLLVNTLFYLLRVMFAAAAGLCAPWLASKSKKKRDPVRIATAVSALALTLLPVIIDVFGSLIPFLSSAGINQIRAELWKLILEYVLSFVFGLLGYAAAWVYLELIAKKSRGKID